MTTTPDDPMRTELLQRIEELSPNGRRMIFAYGTAMLDRSAGRMTEADAATFAALRKPDIDNLDEIEAWLIEHGYLKVDQP
jgi:O-methyltransferase involved in polyketide biosynthesis